MNTLPFMYQTQTAGTESRPRPTSNPDEGRGAGRTAFGPVMRDAASHTRAENSSARNNSGNNAQNNSDVPRKELGHSGRDADMAGAAAAPQNKGTEDDVSIAKSKGERGDSAASTPVRGSSEELTGTSKSSAKEISPEEDTGYVLTGAESEKLQKKLKKIMQTLEQNPAARKITAELQDILRGVKDSASISEALPRLNLSESQTQTLQQILQGSQDGASISEALPRLNLSESQTQTLQEILQGSQDGASISEALPRLNLSESQTQTLQEILQGSQDSASISEALPRLNLSQSQMQKLQETLSALKLMQGKGSVNNSAEGSAQLKGKLTDLLAMVEQTVRRAQQGAQLQTVTQLKQPEIVEGFLLRTEQGRGSFNAAAKIDDPRFAALLNKTTDFSSLRERQGQQNAPQPDIPSARLAAMNPQEQAQSLIQQARAEMATANGEAGATGKGVLEGQAQLGSGNTGTPGSVTADLMGMKGMAEAAAAKDNGAVDFSAAQKGTGIGNNSTDPGILTLKNGTSIPNARVVDQTVKHLNLHARGDSSVVTVKLYPEELGELNIRMVMEGDQLKLQIQAQNQQVREILEQNFPRLRTAMEDQGVTVEDFQVSLGDSRAEDQAGTQSDDELSRHRSADGTTGIAEADSDESESTDSPRRVTSVGGLSVHV